MVLRALFLYLEHKQSVNKKVSLDYCSFGKALLTIVNLLTFFCFFSKLNKVNAIGTDDTIVTSLSLFQNFTAFLSKRPYCHNICIVIYEMFVFTKLLFV